VIKNRADIAKILLKQNIDIDYEDNDQMNAIDNAWLNYEKALKCREKQTSEEILMILLEANSKYPKKYDHTKAPESVKKFEDMSKKVRSSTGNLDQLKWEIKNHPKLLYYYNKDNVSLMSHAVDSNLYEAYIVMYELNLKMGKHEDSVKAYTDQYEKFAILTRNQNRENAITLPSAHLSVLLSKSHISNNDDQTDEHWILIKDAFMLLDKDENCSIILQVAATWIPLKIFFDFKHESTYYFDLTTSTNTLGIISHFGQITIGAKSLSNDKEKSKVIGTVIHELCHCAALIVYMNGFYPYPMGESDDKNKYEEVMAESLAKRNLEPIIKNVFECYRPQDRPLELIVRPMQIKIEYQVNSRMQIASTNFPKLFEYFKDIFIRDLKEALPLLKKLKEVPPRIEWKDLTSAMRAKILHKKVTFQGKIVNLIDLLGDNAYNIKEFRDFMTPKEIEDILITSPNKDIEIDARVRKYPRQKMIRRNFTNISNIKAKSSAEIISDVKTSKIFILTEATGAGKTTLFEKFEEKLKIFNKLSWVSLVKMEEHRKMLQDIKENFDGLTILKKLLNVKPGLEEIVFDKLYINGKLILLVDGLDGICKDSRKIIINTLKTIRQNPGNHLLISTRPHIENELTDFPRNSFYKFLPYEEQDISNFLNFMRNPNLDECFIPFLNHIQSQRYRRDHTLDNPSIFCSIVKFCAKDIMHYQNDSSNIHSILKFLCDDQQTVFCKKAEFDLSSLKNNTYDYYQFHALNTIFSNYEMEVDDLSFIKTFQKKNLRKLNMEHIQSYGIIVLEPNSTDYNFAHITFAEYFVTKYFVKQMFKPDLDKKIEVHIRNINFLRNVAKLVNDFSMIHKFIFSYMLKKNTKPLESDIHEAAKESIPGIRTDIRDSYKNGHQEDLQAFWRAIFSKNHDLLKELDKTIAM